MVRSKPYSEEIAMKKSDFNFLLVAVIIILLIAGLLTTAGDGQASGPALRGDSTTVTAVAKLPNPSVVIRQLYSFRLC